MYAIFARWQLASSLQHGISRRYGGKRFIRTQITSIFLSLPARYALAQPGGGGTPPPRNWVHKKIPGCAVELNTQNCAWFGSQNSLITAMSFRMLCPPNHPPGALPLDPAGGLPFSRPPVPPSPPNPGYATGPRCRQRMAILLLQL